ncbi:methyltransferase family protein [Desulfobacula toluolica]|uniref:Conserved uncharacterized protein n=1 Tax=Desulfobacula toluolica (strain DSM 7467 / Tol2) TaxID=651182 RepID=K0NIT3_DESTT|nr:isoprenylcysteine carboxylmethyltransferase family protein [Desulfobacula toluolica]CCK81331.1 conserved uncharacterized protein [Desulfobacula toluolica Tol2]
MSLEKTCSKTLNEDSPNVNLMPPTVFFICLLAGGVLEFIYPHNIDILSASANLMTGIFIGIGGFIFMYIGHEKFKKTGTNVSTNLPATELVVQGTYRFTRNPMYLGGSIFFIGIGLAAGSLWILAAYLPLFLYLSYYVIPHEEAYMERTFGEEYIQYCRKVRRWI